METKHSNTKVAKKSISILLSVLMVLSCFSVAFPTIAKAAATTQQINELRSALAAFVNSGETGSYSVTGNMANGNYHIYDNTSQGYVYNVAVKLAPVFAGEMSTATGSGYNWWTLMRSRIKSLTGYSSGVGATLIDNLLPVISSYDYNNKYFQESGIFGSTPDRALTAYGNLYVRVSRTVNAALMSYANLSQVPNNLDITFQYYCDTAEPTETGESGSWYNKRKWRREWYAFGSGLSYGVSAQDTTTAPAIKAAYNHFTPALVGLSTYDLTVQYDATTIASLINTNNSYWSTVNSLATAIKNKFFTNPTVNDIQAFMGRAVIAQQVISLLPANTWYLNAMAAGYDTQNYSQMTSLYSTAVPYYNSLNGASADAKSVLTANYSMNLNAFNAWKEQLFDDIQIYELRELKNTIDQKIAEVNQYKIPDEQYPIYKPHVYFGDANTELTNTHLDVASGQFAGWLSAIGPYQQENINQVFPEGTGYIQAVLASINYEIQVRNYESVYAPFYEYFTPWFAKDLTEVNSTYIIEKLYPEVIAKQSAFNTQYNNAVNILGQEAVNIIFGTLKTDIVDFIDKMHKELEARITAEVNLAYSYYTAFNQITYQNFTLVKDAIGRVETNIYDFLAPKAYMTQDTRNKYNALFGTILQQYNNFVNTGGFSIYQQQTFDGGTGIYYVRTPMEQDLARTTEYRVTEQRLLDTLNKLDDLLQSPDFAELVGLDGTVEQMVLDLLADELFSDKTVNELVGLLYPMLVKMFEEDLIGRIPSSIDTGTPFGSVDIGLRYTPRELCNTIGLRVYPDQFATLIDSSFAQVKNELASKTSWTPLLDEDNNLNLNWGVDEAEGYHAKKARFMSAVDQALRGVLPLFRVLLCNYTWSVSINKVGYGEKDLGILGSIKINVDLDLTADGCHGYINTLAPILETLGCSPSLIRNASQIQSVSTSGAIVNAIFEPIIDFVENKLAKAPLNTFTEMIPNLAYAISFGRITPLLENLATSIRYKVKTDVLSITVLEDSYPINAAEMIDIENLGLDLTSLNGLLRGFLSDKDKIEEGDNGTPTPPAKLPPLINTGLVSFLGRLEIVSSVRQVSKTGLPAGQRYNIKADKADVFYYLLTYLIEAIQDPDFLESVLDFFGSGDDDEEETTAPTTEPTTGPTTEPTTGPTTEPTTGPTTEPTTEPVTFEVPEILDKLLGEIGLDINAWNKYHENYDWGFEDGDRDGFMGALNEVLKPLSPVLNLLLAGKNINLFKGKSGNPFISVLGYSGYAYGLVPLLEALGTKNLMTKAEYEAAVAADPTAALELVINPLLGRLDEIAADPIGEALQILPSLLHYIDNGGVQATINNVLHPLYVLLDTVRPIVSITLEDIINGELPDLDTDLILSGLAADPAKGIAVIVELLNPQRYDMDTIEWKYTQNTNPEASPSLVYLTYGNRWTKTKATDVYNNIEDIVKTLIDDEDFTSLSDLITETINGLFEVDTIKSLAETLRDLVGSLFDDDDDDDDEEPSETTTADPTDPTEPTEPTEPTDPTDPTEPTEPEDPEEPDDDFKFEFGMIFDISLPWVLNLLETQFGEGLKFADLLGSTFDYLFTRVAMPYTSANGQTAYRTYGVLDNVDVFTCVLTMLLEVVLHGNNAEILDEMLGTDGILPAVTGLFDGLINDMGEINWLWFSDDYTGPLYGDSDVQLPERSIVYLTYPNNWSKGVANYLDANLADIVDSVISTIDDDYASLAEMLADQVDFYNDDTVNSLLKVFKDLIADIDRALLDTVGVVLELDLTAWDAYEYDHEWGVTDRESFIDALCEVLMPLAEAVDWLLYGDDYTFFHHSAHSGEAGSNLITIKGADGYAYGLVPLLEALGCKNVLSQTAIKEELAANPQSPVRFKAILEPLLARLDEIVANPVDELLGIIPNLIFFINANGLSVSVKNTLHAVLNIFEAVAPALDTSLDELIGFSIDDLTFTGIFTILKDKTGIDLNAPIGEFMSTFWLGDLEVYTSANGNGAIRMSYSEDEHRGDLITIIFCLLLQVIEHENNAEILRDMLGSDTYDAVLNVLNLQEFPMQEISWYNTEYADTGVVFSALNTSELFSSSYGRLWTKDKADYIASNFGTTVDNIIKLLGIEGENGQLLKSLNELINDLADGNIYTSANVNSVAEMFQDFVAQIDELGEAGEHAKALIYEIFGIDLNHWNQFGPDYDWGFENGDRAAF
ncbi:MAG TPA: hypothetical protein PKY39_08240, partial [Clostridiales bacterium]|nr:hypothetical protein [Clostridiales bacterium]